MKRFLVVAALLVTLTVLTDLQPASAQEPAPLPETAVTQADDLNPASDADTDDALILDSGDLPERTSNVFSLRDVTLMALRNNLNVKINRINPRIAETNVVTAKAVFDPTAEATLSGGHNDGPTIDAADNITHDRSDSVSASAKLSKKFETGTTASVTLSATDSDSDDADPSVASELELSVTHPLLRGAGLRVNTADVVIARNNTRISESEFKSEVIDTIAETQKTYWELVFALENLDVRKRSWRLSRRTLMQTQAQVEAGVLARIEITRVRADVASKEEGILNAQRSVEDRVDQLRRYIKDPASELTDDIGIVPLDRATYADAQLDLMTEINAALTRRPDFLQTRIDIENNDLELVKTRNDRLPTLDLTGTLEVNGLGRHIDDSVELMGEGDYVDWRLQATLTYPLGNRAALSAHTRARLARIQSVLQLKNLEDAIIIEVKQAVRKVNTDFKRIRSTRLARELAQERLAAEEEKLNVGQVIILDVLEAQTLLAEAEAAERRAIVDYNNSLIDLERAKGTVLEANSIGLSEGRR